jgi:hypothetical protein
VHPAPTETCKFGGMDDDEQLRAFFAELPPLRLEWVL